LINPVEERLRAAHARDRTADGQGSTIANTKRIRDAGSRPRPQGETMADDRRTPTNRQGHPVADNQNQRTVGDRVALA
jgi:hypothetical protein